MLFRSAWHPDAGAARTGGGARWADQRRRDGRTGGGARRADRGRKMGAVEEREEEREGGNQGISGEGDHF